MTPAGSSRVLIVEDELDLAEMIRDNLHATGCMAEIAGDGEQALAAIAARDYDLVILDVMLPGRDGFSVCESLRRRGCASPVLFLTALRESDDRIRGLEVGGDDYLAKPFQLRELLLRVQALLRRGAGGGGAARPTVRFGDNVVDLDEARAVAWDGTRHRLSRAEVGVLQVLLERGDEVVTPQRILEDVWRDDVFPSTRTVRRLVTALAERFEPDPSRPRYFHAVPGEGYRFTREPAEG